MVCCFMDCSDFWFIVGLLGCVLCCFYLVLFIVCVGWLVLLALVGGFWFDVVSFVGVWLGCLLFKL